MENFFDPREYVRGLQNIFIHDSKKIGFLFGAGTSFAIKHAASESSRVPQIKKMTEIIIEKIKSIKDAKSKIIYETAINDIISDLEESKIDPNIEEILSNVIQKEKIIGKSVLSTLNKDGWSKLKIEIEDLIKEIVSVHKKKSEFIGNLNHCDFADWIKKVERKFSVEIFTTNYDYLLELGFEQKELPYFDGFIGSYNPWFYSSSVEKMSFLPECTKLWKLHGSLGWDFDGKKITRCLPVDTKIMIYPSILKYDDSKKQPYTSFMDRLGNFLKQDDSILFICGYSFGDQHINSVILNALENSSSSHVVALLYDKYEEDKFYFYSLNENCNVNKLAKENPKLSVYGMNSAIIGGKFGRWKLKDKVTNDDDAIILDLYFEDNYSADGFVPKGIFQRIKDIDKKKSIEIWTEINAKKYIDDKGILTKTFIDEKDDSKIVIDDKYKDIRNDIISILRGCLVWSGDGEFKLPDFSQFVNFLINLNSEDYIKKMSKTS